MGAIVDCICKDKKKDEHKTTQDGKTSDKSNSPSPTKLINTTLNEYSPNSLLPNTYQEEKGNISLENADEKVLFRGHRKEETKGVIFSNEEKKYIPSKNYNNQEISFNLVIEEGKRVELSFKLKEFNNVFEELKTLFKDDSFASEIEEELINLEYLAFIRFIHDNPLFQPTIEDGLGKLEKSLYNELLSKVLYNPSIKVENAKSMKEEIINQYVDKADKILSTNLPKCLIEPYMLNINRLIDRKIKKEKMGLKEWEIKQGIKEEYTKSNLNIAVSVSNVVPMYVGYEQTEELIDSSIWGKPDYSEGWEKACNILLEKILESKLEPFDYRIYININYTEFLKTIINIIQNSKRTFVPQIYQDFKELNNDFIKSLPSSIDKYKLLQDCQLYLQDVDNKIQRKNGILRALSFYKMFEANFTITQKLFTLFSIFLSLSGSYEGKPFNGNPDAISDNSKVVNSGKSGGFSKSIENFKNAPYKPISREIARKVLKYLLRRSEPNATVYSFRKLLSFEKTIGIFLKKHEIRTINETFISKEFLLKERTSIELKEMMKQIHTKYENNEKYIKLINLLIPNKNKNLGDNLKELLESERIFKLERINDNSTSKNLILCISGFWSENYDEKIDWEKVVKFFPESQILNIRWASTTLLDFMGYVAGYSTIFPMIMYSIYRLFKKKGPNTFQKLSQNFWKNMGLSSEQQEKLKNTKDEKSLKSELESLCPPNSYDDAKENAELAGALLAFLIALRVPSDIENISIISFSLGSQVLSECLCYLQHFSSFNRIHDVIFFAGAAKIELNNERNIQSFHVVNGKVFNSFSKKDWALWFLSKVGYNTLPIGTYPFQIPNSKKSETSIYNAGRTIRNYENELGHLDYRKNMDTLLSQLYQRYLVNI